MLWLLFVGVLLFEGSGGEAFLPVFLEGEEGDGQGDDGDEAGGDDEVLDGLASGGVGLVFPLVQSDGQGVPGGVFDHDEG